MPSSARSQGAGGDTICLSIQEARALSAAVSRAFEYSDKLDSARVAIALQDSLISKIEAGYRLRIAEDAEKLEALEKERNREWRRKRIWQGTSVALLGAVASLGLVIVL